MQINVGCFYFIKDTFFDIIDDPELMKNKENGNKRPCYYCFKCVVLFLLLFAQNFDNTNQNSLLF